MAMGRVDAETPPKLFVDPLTYTATFLGEVFSINISITNITDLNAWDFKLGYNTTLLDVLEAVEGPFPPYSDFTIDINEPEGYVWIYGMCVSATGNGTLATITYNVTHAAPASCTLDIFGDGLYDAYYEPIEHTAEDGNYEFAVLGITVATNKPCYYQGKNVTVYGNLTKNGFFYEGLVAVEVYNPLSVMVARTLQTGSPPPPGDISVVEVFPSDILGYPKSSFTRGSVAYFTVTLRNDGTESKYVRITINAYDRNMCPIPGVPSTLLQVSPGIHPKIAIAPILIPMTASVGEGTVYASAFTNWPHASGVPYCPEASATFNIEVSGQGPGASGSGFQGNYNLSFRLNVWAAQKGNYTVYVSSRYGEQEVFANTTFEVKIFADVNDDGAVDVADTSIVIYVVSRVPGWEDYETKADLDKNGELDIADVGLALRAASGIILRDCS